MKRTLPTFVVTVFAFAAMTSVAWAQHPIVGSWKTNPAKSKVLLGSPGLTYVATYEANGPNGIKGVSERTNPQGEVTRIEFTANLDGKTYPYKGGNLARDGISLTPIDSHIIRVSYKLRGETNQINYFIVSRDGKTLTTVSTNGNAANGVYSRMVVAERQ